ncbi:MAG: ribose-phosphate pyrophosphokinase [Bacteroidales bacterium]|jgi:ribose-phosphate pyrophosphokinase|nr:ribose-phosphate pyrophosphokinase [Bacteroidales bacterium]MDD3668661.1 ribose-phosphate pyrophosphokinase [Bacteroidales bacterium]MDD4739483.1 ribose-phosphate pyrophosphokinase [Bacteroidales bacterium]MEA5100058.1 ribose-phosphate pyrophosphokinase [Bacteroidales bacterium]NCC18696.1 ribose-phosphate pyrophosphokinase [Bacteroidia bacterium]
MQTDKPKDSVAIFTGRATAYLAKDIANIYGKPIGDSQVLQYADGEFQPSFEENIRGRDVFIIQSTFAPADNLMELLMYVDAAKRASAKRIIAVIPYFGFARQDRKDKPRVPITAKLVADILTAVGVTRVITIDLHADQIQGFFNVPVDHLYASSIFIPYLRGLASESFNLDDVLFASPDVGGTKRASEYAKKLGCGFVMCYKQRNKPNEIGTMQLIGDVSGKHVILVDDIVDTGSTLCKAAELISSKGAKSVRAMITHPVLSGDAVEKIENSQMVELIVTDTIPLKQISSKIRALSVAPIFAEAIRRVEFNESIADFYEMAISKKGLTIKF